MKASPDRSAIVLASASSARRMLLQNAGIDVAIEPARVDEDAVKEAMRADSASPRDVADALAELKALKISGKYPDAFVIGADQTLDCEGRWFDKPADRAAARRHLEDLSGKTHALQSAVCVARNGAILWRHVGVARLTMRPLSPAFLDWYLDRMGDDALDSVGSYRLEGIGSQLFSAVDGDYFTVLGLPLLPLMAFLRGHGMVVA